MGSISNMISYILNPKLKEHSEQVFQGIEFGRTKALYNWFNDVWTSIDLSRGKLEVNDNIFVENDISKMNQILIYQKEQFKHFSEIFIVNNKNKIISSTYSKFVGKEIVSEYKNIFNKKEKYMYGPNIDIYIINI